MSKLISGVRFTMVGLADRPVDGGFLRVASNAELAAAEDSRRLDSDQTYRATRLGSHIAGCFLVNFEHKRRFIQGRLDDCLRRRMGQYDSFQAANIAQVGGCNTYFNITDQKARTAKAHLEDIIAPSGDKPWALAATPIPDLPADVQERLVQAVTIHFAGMEPSSDELRDYTMDLYDRTMRMMADEARARAERMDKRIEDQLAEAGFISALYEFLDYFVTYPTAFLKLPVPRAMSRLRWGGNHSPEVVTEVAIQAEAPNPQDMYPSPNARTCDEGNLIEVITLNVSMLPKMKGQPGWNSEAIDGALEEMRDGATNLTAMYVQEQAARADLEGRDTNINVGVAIGQSQALLFWGPVQGITLIDWGMRLPLNRSPFEFYEASAILMGRHVLYAELNPNPLGKRPYMHASFNRVPGSLWGRGLPEMIKDCQDPFNAVNRAAVNNASIASGPSIVYDVAAIEPAHRPTRLQPWQLIPWNSAKVQGQSNYRPVDFHQPTNNTSELLTLATHYEDQSDNRLGLPRYAYGNDRAQGAGSTYSGLQALLDQMGKGLKAIVMDLDEYVIRRGVTMLYEWNMLYLDEPALKGDLRVLPRGVVALLVKDQTRMRQVEFLGLTNNPIDMAIIGAKGRRALLEAVAETTGLDKNAIVPTEDELLQQQQALMKQQAATLGYERAVPAEVA